MDYAGLISIVQIEGIRIADAMFRTKLSNPEEAGELQATIGHRVKLVPSPLKGKLVYRVLFSFAVTPQKIDEKVTPPEDLVTVKAAFELTYAVPPDGEQPDQKIIEDFGNMNVLFNAWPYWREFLQSTLGRMALPAFVTPVLRLLPPGSEQKSEESTLEQGTV